MHNSIQFPKELEDRLRKDLNLDIPVHYLVYQFRICVNLGLFYQAILLGLILPDQCAALESVDNITTGDKYKNWCSKWLQEFVMNSAPETPAELWKMRCKLVHQGRVHDPSVSHYTGGIAFTLPDVNQNIYHNNMFVFTGQNGEEDLRYLGIYFYEFASHIDSAVLRWYYENRENQIVHANMVNIIRYYDGVYEFGGFPVIA